MTSGDKRQLAGQLGCSLNMIFVWLRREQFPSRENARKIVELTNWKVDYNDIYHISQKEQAKIDQLKALKKELKLQR